MGLTGLDINFLLVSDRAIRRYNRRYLHHDRPTDVIAFPYFTLTPTLSRGGRGRGRCLLPLRDKARMRGGPLGDILISSDTAKRQARGLGHPLLTEVKILAIHGLLHLLGYRDKKKGDWMRMWKKTDQLLKLIQSL